MPASRTEIEALFEEALDVETRERQAWLAVRCGDDRALRTEVEALLVAHETPRGMLDGSLSALAGAVTGDVVRGRRIGPYRVIRELGRGGMGVVYLADRVDGAYRREVAIKLLRNSPDAEELHRRFLAERQILASLSHPNIAQLLDGGTTDGQLPYLVMEYVDGLPITAYCDRNRLDVAARLRLFQEVCRAVHAAHQSLIIHRDLKPGNILVTGTGQVKLLDFGIAKLLNPALGSLDAPHTRTALRVMTPEYASPEQVRGESLGTASDIYALGVVLYELLAGRRPYYLRTGAPRELHDLVCDREPDRPSTVITRREALALDDRSATELDPEAMAARRAASPERLRRQLRGDVDAIVMMALRKEPRRRYGSAELMCEDIGRHLEGQPIAANRGTRGYRLRKLAGRHRVAVAAGALAVLSLAGGAAVAVKQAAVAGRERDRATAALLRMEQVLRESEEMTGFLVGLFDAGALAPMGSGRGTTEDLLLRGAAQVERQERQPLVQARMLEAMGRVHRALGDLPRARVALERSLALRRTRGGDAAETAATILQLADVLRRQGDYAAAEALALEGLALRRRHRGRDDLEVADPLAQLSGLAVYRGDLAAAESLAREALAIRRSALPAGDVRLVSGLDLLAGTLRRRGAIDEAERLLAEAIGITERTLGPWDPAIAPLLLRRADLHADDRGNLADAAPLYERAVAILTRSLGEAHPQTATALGDLGVLRSRQGRHAEAERLVRRALEIRTRTVGPRHPTMVDARSQLTAVLLREGRLDEAEHEQREVLRLVAELLGREHSAYAGSLGDLGDVMLARGRLDEAESMYRQAIDIRRPALGGETNSVALIVIALGEVHARRGDFAGADSLYRQALRVLRWQMTDEHREVRHVYGRLAALYEANGLRAEAVAFRDRAVLREVSR